MRILCFGDSNTYGYDPRGFYGGRYDADDRWPELLAKQTGWNVLNQGANGREIPRECSWLTDSAPEDIILIMLGTNDLLQGTSAAEAARQMDAFLNSLLPHCKNVLLAAPPILKRGTWVPTEALTAESIRLAEEYNRIAERRNIRFVDTRSWNIPLAFDGVHFTEAGHHVFADQLGERLRTSLPLIEK